MSERVKGYDSSYGDYPLLELTVYEGIEVGIEFVLTPKVKKASK